MTTEHEGVGFRLECPVAGRDFIAAGEAAARIKRVLQQVGMDPETIRRAAIVAYEAEMNIVIHAHWGTLTALITPGRIDIIAADEGPGIADIPLAMQEGYSTAPDDIRELGFGAGMGLPNIKRNSDELSIQSTVGVGTVLHATILIRKG